MALWVWCNGLRVVPPPLMLHATLHTMNWTPLSGELIKCLLCVDMQERKNSDRTLHDTIQCGPGLSRNCRK